MATLLQNTNKPDIFTIRGGNKKEQKIKMRKIERKTNKPIQHMPIFMLPSSQQPHAY